jgi:hypothetical protein
LVKRIFLTLLQFLVFGALLVVGAFWALVRIFFPRLAFIPVWRFQAGPAHDFVANGLIFALVLLVFLLLIEALRKALKPAGVLTVLAFALAVALSLAMKVGLLTVSQ